MDGWTWSAVVIIIVISRGGIVITRGGTVITRGGIVITRGCCIASHRINGDDAL